MQVLLLSLKLENELTGTLKMLGWKHKFCQLNILPKMSITFQKHNALKVQTASGVKWDIFYILVPLTSHW